MTKTFIRCALVWAAFALPGTSLAQNVKIGFVTTLTTGAAVIGNDMRDAVNLAVEDLNGKMGDLDIEVIFADDGFKPETGKQVTDKLVKSDDVDFVAGYIWSHVLLASQKSVLSAEKFLISANAGPSQLAGKTLPSRLLFNLLAERSDPDGHGRSAESTRDWQALRYGAQLCRRQKHGCRRRAHFQG